RRLPAAGLARDPERLAVVEPEADAIDRLDAALRQGEPDGEVLDPQQRRTRDGELRERPLPASPDEGCVPRDGWSGGERRGRLGHRRPWDFGFRTSSRAFPSNVNERTTRTTAAAGGTMYHQAPRPGAPAAWALLRIWPHDGAAGSPRPMKASVVSVNTAVANVSTAWATIRFTTFGRMCRRMIRP